VFPPASQEHALQSSNREPSSTGVRSRRNFVSIFTLFLGGYFTILKGAFLALRVPITTGGGAGGRSSTCIWSAKRSLPIWQMIVEVPGTSDGLGNGNTLFLRLFITQSCLALGAIASLRNGLNPAR
jgi:hypothetical protein